MRRLGTWTRRWPRHRRHFSATVPLYWYHQEIFMPSQDFFLVQVMRGLKVEKRYEPGMGFGVFVREAMHAGEMVMYDLPFMSLNLEEIPQNMAEKLTTSGVEQNVNSVLGAVCEELSRLSGESEEHAKQWITEKGIETDLMWVTLLAHWGKHWCNSKNPNEQVPLSYLSYRDDFREDDLEARVMVLGYTAICDVIGMDQEAWDVDEFWRTLYKVRSNIFRDKLHPVCPSLINHSCWPSAQITADGALVTLRDLPPGEQITVSLYGSSCEEVKEKGLCGQHFKCMTPGCEWSKRVPGLEGKPEEVQALRAEDMEYLTPWHAASVKMPQLGVDAGLLSAVSKTPSDKKFQQMWDNEVTRAGRVIGEVPRLPGARRIAPGTGVIHRDKQTGKYITPPDSKEISIHDGRTELGFLKHRKKL
eukprot:Hpha_TRINITY_DN23962_c0_g1::TRINITY_DN23962_c0_g1_i1::g.137763::m.137763